MAAKSLLTSGLRKTIGSGRTTRVWLDPWIPGNPARPVKNRTAETDPHLYVDYFIDRDSNQWNYERLQALIDPSDIPVIMGMRISRTYLSDGYSWDGTKSGNYTVKSGYWAARDLSRQTRDLPFQGPGIKPLQAQVWKLKTTRKLKHFVWQCLSGCLATNQTLYHRHIGKEKQCPRCGAEEETINHILFECPPALQTWALSMIPSSPSSFPRQSLFYNIDFLYWRASRLMPGEENTKQFTWIMWYLWKARNKFIFENVRETPQEILNQAIQEESAWSLANKKDDPQENNLESCRIPEHINDIRTECQIDASWHATDPYSGHGWVVMEDGHTRLMGLKTSKRGLSPLQAEFESLLWAMECMQEVDKSHINFATDCLELISLLENLSAWPTFAVESQHFQHLKSSFPAFYGRHISRKENTYADNLAKKARTQSDIFSHIGTSAPTWLSLAESSRPIA